MRCIDIYVPWNEIWIFLNSLSIPSRAEGPSFSFRGFPETEEGPGRLIPEDFVLRGQLYVQSYFSRKLVHRCNDRWWWTVIGSPINASAADGKNTLARLSICAYRPLLTSQRMRGLDVGKSLANSSCKHLAVRTSNCLCVFAFANMGSLTDRLLGIAVHILCQVLASQRLCGLDPERS